jgi:hypothetical protein
MGWRFGQPLGKYEDWFEGQVYLAFLEVRDQGIRPGLDRDPRAYVKSDWEFELLHGLANDYEPGFFKKLSRDKRNAKRRFIYRQEKKKKK